MKTFEKREMPVLSRTGEKIEPCEIIQNVKLFNLNLEYAIEDNKSSQQAY